jgi:serine phosphatase RsbU (regulator of sigma subunit)
MLGIAPDRERADNVVTLDRGATVLLYTDGLIESRARPLSQGLVDLREALKGMGRDDLDTLCDTLVAQLPTEPAEDDIALVGVRLHPQDRPRPAVAGPTRVPPDVPDDE